MFEEDLESYFADFGMEAQANGDVALVIFDMPDQVFVSDMQMITEYQITYKFCDFTKLKTGDLVYVNRAKYSVKTVSRINDGRLRAATLTYITNL